jgi:AbrB family looped-hinge helix DNA binding protein
MEASRLSTAGQVTIPYRVRKLLNLSSGDLVDFVLDGDQVRILRRENKIEAAFGLIKIKQPRPQQKSNFQFKSR